MARCPGVESENDCERRGFCSGFQKVTLTMSFRPGKCHVQSCIPSGSRSATHPLHWQQQFGRSPNCSRNRSRVAGSQYILPSIGQDNVGFSELIADAFEIHRSAAAARCVSVYGDFDSQMSRRRIRPSCLLLRKVENRQRQQKCRARR